MTCRAYLRPFVMLVALAVVPVDASAQIAAPNASGVSVAQIHLTVRDPDAHRKLWELVGGIPTRTGSLEGLRFPGVFVILAQGEPTGGSEGSTVNHVGFAVRSVDDIRAKLSAAGLPTVQELTNPKRWVTMFPDSVKVEFVDDPMLPVAIAGHHIHVSTPDMEPLRDWYVKTFGAAAATRRGFPSAVFNGEEVDMIQADAPQAPTQGRSIDHIGFEVTGLEAFCRRLQAAGVTLDVPYGDGPQLGVKRAYITDPAGTRIELTEGLAGR